MTDVMKGGVSDAETLHTASNEDGGFLSGLFNRNGNRSDRKTVTFGDSGAVRSMPLWSIVSLIALIVGWWAVTRAWGFPDDVQQRIEAEYAAEGTTLTDLQLLTECRIADDCSEDDYTRLVNQNALPTPSDTWQAFNTVRTEGYRNVSLWEHTSTSLFRVGVGMFFGTLIGVPLGFAMGLSSRVRGFLDTPVELFRPIPPLALIPLFILWFGIGNPSSFALLIFASVWIMLISARSGVRAVSLSKVRAAYSLGASKLQVLFRLIVPNALPELFTGIRVALGVSWGTLVAAELVGTDIGLGAMIFAARSFIRSDIVVMGIIIIAIIGVLLDVVVRLLEAVLIPWRGKGG
ncbi:MAG: ABC transporter permease [Actinomycetota bacterium]